MHRDLREIVPAELYSDADLDWMDRKSRSTLEMKDEKSRPAMKNRIDAKSYDIVFFGFPIWWGKEPRSLDTFVESYDFGGKTMIPFATSVGSGIGTEQANLQALANGGTWLEGRRMNGSTSESDVSDWISSLGF